MHAKVGCRDNIASTYLDNILVGIKLETCDIVVNNVHSEITTPRKQGPFRGELTLEEN